MRIFTYMDARSNRGQDIAQKPRVLDGDPRCAAGSNQRVLSISMVFQAAEKRLNGRRRTRRFLVRENRFHFRFPRLTTKFIQQSPE